MGGAALTPKFVYEDCQNTYKGKVVYGKDAFSDLPFMDKLMPAKAAASWDNLQGFSGDYNGANHLCPEERGDKSAEKVAEKNSKAAEP